MAPHTENDVDIRALAETCVDDMGDVFWDFDPERDAGGGYTDPREVATKAVAAALSSLQVEVDRQSLCPRSFLDEYSTLAAEVGDDAPDAKLIAALVSQADWTPRGAEEVLRLAQEYGTSILRNALALAEAMDIEDGSRGL